MANYTSTQRFLKISGYLLLEYNYTTSPTPEIYYVNTGVPAVGFEKIVNGHLDNSVQILNKPESQSLTGNVRDLSVVQIDKNRFVSLSNDSLKPYLDVDPKLTPVDNLPVIFPSNIDVYYDTLRFHIVSGYNFENMDGIILQGQFQERTGKKATIFQRLITKSDTSSIILNPNPIYLGGSLYDHYIEVKIPAYANTTYEFDLLNGSPSQASTLAAKISSDGNGFIKDTPINVNVYEINQSVLKDGYYNYIAQVKNQVSIFPKDNFTDLAANIEENTIYNYLEFYPSWEGNFLEDFLSEEGKVGNSYYVVNDIEVKEQVGLSYVTTYNFSSTQTSDFNSATIFRPILKNPLATSFLVNYTMRLVNRNTQNQIIRIASFSSLDVNRYGKENNVITLSTGAYSQKVYNKISQAPSVTSGGIISNPALPVEKRIPVFYKDTNISITKENLVIDKNGNIISENSASGSSTQIYAQGKASIVVDPFDNFYKFSVYNYTQGNSPIKLDLGTSLTYYMVFLDKNSQSVKTENIKNLTSISNPVDGQIAFKIVQTNSKKILGFTSRDFYLISKTPDGLETKLYSGSWETQEEFTKRNSEKVTNTTNTTNTSNQFSEPLSFASSEAASAKLENITEENPRSSIVKGDQIKFNVPQTRITKKVNPYSMGSSSILSVKPLSVLNTTGGFVETSKSVAPAQKINTQFEKFTSPGNVASLADSISGRESQGLDVKNVINYYFTPGAPGEKLFKGLKSEDFLIASLQIHPKLPNGEFDPKYIQYCNALSFPVTDNPGSSNRGV